MNANLNSERDIWTDEVMHSLDGMQRATPSPFLYTRIIARLQDAVPVPKKYMWLTAAGFACLLLVNIAILKSSPAPSSTQSLSEQLQLNVPSTIDYR